jgi:hypothetical protein
VNDVKYKIGQDFEYVGNDYWRWSAWIDADDAQLDRIKQVVWILHPTFRNPRVATTDRAQKFMLKTAGWGTFRLRAEIELADGENVSISKNLKLEYPEDAQTDADAALMAPFEGEPVAIVSEHVALASERGQLGAARAGVDSQPALSTKRAPSPRHRSGSKVFLSYGSEDAELVVPLRQALIQDGAQVLDVNQVAAGASWQDEVNRLIARSDMVVGVVGHDYVSPFVVAELGRARGGEKQVCVVTNKGEEPFGLPADVARIPIDMSNADFGEVVAFVNGRNKDSVFGG